MVFDDIAHRCMVYDIYILSEVRYLVKCAECGKTKYFNAETKEFEDKIYPKDDEAEYNPVTLKYMV